MAAKTPKKAAQSKAQSNRGGKRTGAGPKTKAERELRDRLIAGLHETPDPEVVAARISQTAEAIVRLDPRKTAAERALQLFEQVMDGEYTVDVRLKAAREILDRVIGKPRQAVEVSGADGKAGPQVIVYIPDNGRDSAEQES